MKSLSLLSHARYAVVVLPELLVLGIIAAMYALTPDALSWISGVISDDSSFRGYLLSVPLAFILGSVKIGKDILVPGTEEQNRALFNWPMYWLLKGLVLGSHCLCALCFVAVLAFYFGHSHWNSATSGAILLSAIAVSVVNLFTLLMAKYEIKQIMTVYS